MILGFINDLAIAIFLASSATSRQSKPTTFITVPRTWNRQKIIFPYSLIPAASGLIDIRTANAWRRGPPFAYAAMCVRPLELQIHSIRRRAGRARPGVDMCDHDRVDPTPTCVPRSRCQQDLPVHAHTRHVSSNTVHILMYGSTRIHLRSVLTMLSDKIPRLTFV